MKRRQCFIAMGIAILIFQTGLTSAHASDAMHRFMHNDHDALVIGEVARAVDNGCILQVFDTINTEPDWNGDGQSAPEIQIDGISQQVI